MPPKIVARCCSPEWASFERPSDIAKAVSVYQAEPLLRSGGSSRESMTVLVYVNTSKQVGDRDHIKVFANVDAAEKWFEENDPEGVAFEYEVLE
jgi:hypothetical protein